MPVEVVIPGTTFWDHKEAKEFVGQDHLHFLEEACIVVGWVGLNVFFVGFAPFNAKGCQLVDGKRARSSGEAACCDHRGLSIPCLVALKQSGVHLSAEG